MVLLINTMRQGGCDPRGTLDLPGLEGVIPSAAEAVRCSYPVHGFMVAVCRNCLKGDRIEEGRGALHLREEVDVHHPCSRFTVYSGCA